MRNMTKMLVLFLACAVASPAFAAISGGGGGGASGFTLGTSITTETDLDVAVDGSISASNQEAIGIGTTIPIARLNVIEAMSAVSTTPNILINSTFADTSAWTIGAGWTIESGVSTHTAGATAALTQNISVISGDTYIVEFDISARSAGTFSVTVGAVTLGDSGTNTAFSTVASYKRTLIAGASGSVAVSIVPVTTFAGSIDNFKVYKRVEPFFPSISFEDTLRGNSIEFRVGGEPSSLYIGRDSGKYRYYGRYNTTLGGNAMLQASVGDGSTAVGYNALATAKYSAFNTAVGYQALYALTTGTNNTALGSGALSQSLTTGSANTAVGYGAGFQSSGSNNVLVGLSAGNSIGGGNVAVGYNAGVYSTGTNNVLLGWAAGQSVTSGNVMLGYNAGSAETGSNKLYIANSNTATPLVYGDFSTSRMTINGSLTITGDATVSSLTGSGDAFLCVNAVGKLFRKDTVCAP
jgi:trimeric autotransporter adhesin